MKFNMTMKKPSTWVVCRKTDDHITFLKCVFDVENY